MSAAQTGSGAFLSVERSVSGKFWRARLEDDRAALALAQQLEISEILARVLAARGITADDAERFLNPALRDTLPDPSVLRDMDKAADLLAAAIQSGEKIAVFGDYDVDGATSGALILRFLNAVGSTGTYYIPDRMREGYGPNAPALKSLAEQGVALVVTVDCGISAFDALDAAATAGLSVIVVDHHIAEPRLPIATAIVNPNRLDDDSGLGQLAAVGVTFLLLVALNRTLRRAGHYKADCPEPDLLGLLDLVALGTVCDVVPLTGLNRALTMQGLKVMAKRGNIGLAALSDSAGLDEAPTAYHAGYVLGPRVNAGGRVGESSLGIRLLTTSDGEAAKAIALHLGELNKERQAIEADVLDAATAQIEARGETPAPIIIAAGAGWHAGVVGIVASRLKERFSRPAIVIAVAEGIGKASCRSITGVDIGAAITAARQAGLLLNGGGHAMAAGFTVAEDQLEALGSFLMDRLAPFVTAARQSVSLGIDGALTVEGATLELVEELAQVGPFGSGNSEPRMVITASRIASAKVVGNGHVRCILAGATGKRLTGIAFRAAGEELGHMLLSPSEGPLHVAGNLRINRWRERDDVQLIIQDAAHASGADWT
ncbi:MAG: single-stranded-DNA-specific exonuclease RecJ [Proteobacteria bacterium]|nr:single-stranded-DNA-specific exonuclease RecJ [Pseudomonadota bacterium]MDA1354999.1 single-stranded-DNA-specific exonuclease RecJ [Pseudomonadota bacterium]